MILSILPRCSEVIPSYVLIREYVEGLRKVLINDTEFYIEKVNAYKPAIHENTEGRKIIGEHIILPSSFVFCIFKPSPRNTNIFTIGGKIRIKPREVPMSRPNHYEVVNSFEEYLKYDSKSITFMTYETY